MGAALAVGCGPGAQGILPAPAGPCRVVGSGGRTGGGLEVRRVFLAFSDGRPDVTVAPGDTPRAAAEVQTRGNGTLRATWLVDGVPVETVACPVRSGDTVRIELGAALPTFEPGPHRLALRIDHPAPGFALPNLRFFVAAFPARRGVP